MGVKGAGGGALAQVPAGRSFCSLINCQRVSATEAACRVRLELSVRLHADIDLCNYLVLAGGLCVRFEKQPHVLSRRHARDRERQTHRRTER